jgi:hypothetical protein
MQYMTAFFYVLLFVCLVLFVNTMLFIIPFISGSRLPVMQLPVIQLPVAHAHTITSGTTTQHHHKCEVDGASILLIMTKENITIEFKIFFTFL